LIYGTIGYAEFSFFFYIYHNRAFKISHSTALSSFKISSISMRTVRLALYVNPVIIKKNPRFLNNPGHRIRYRTGMPNSNSMCHITFQFIFAVYSSVSIYLVENAIVFTNKQRKTNSSQFLFSRFGQWFTSAYSVIIVNPGSIHTCFTIR
jgi:hypothetical protein